MTTVWNEVLAENESAARSQLNECCDSCGSVYLDHYWVNGDWRACRNGKLAWDRAQQREWLEASR